MACQGPCSCCAPTRPAQAPLRAIPAPLPEITFTVTQLPAGDAPTVFVSGVPPVYNVALGIPGAFSPVFGTNVVVNMIPNGDPASGSIDNTDPLNPILTLNIPSPLDGVDGLPPWSAMSSSFTMPTINTSDTGLVVVPDTSYMTNGSWVGMEGAGTGTPSFGWLIVEAVLNGTQAMLRNPGPADLVPVTGVPGNVPAGTIIAATGLPNQIIVSGRLGPTGPAGDAGLTPEVAIVYTVPVSPPSSDAENLVLYFNAAPPSIPTIGRFYSWNGASWDGGPNFVAAGGTRTYTGSADPNVAPPSGANLLDYYIRFQADSATYYQLTAPSTWTLIGTVAMLGMTTLFDTHTAPGDYTVDMAYFSIFITADKDITNLVYDQSNYAGAGSWILQVHNTDGAAINIGYGSALRDPAVTLVTSIPSGDILVVRFIVYDGSFAQVVITDSYIPV